MKYLSPATHRVLHRMVSNELAVMYGYSYEKVSSELVATVLDSLAIFYVNSNHTTDKQILRRMIRSYAKQYIKENKNDYRL